MTSNSQWSAASSNSTSSAGEIKNHSVISIITKNENLREKMKFTYWRLIMSQSHLFGTKLEVLPFSYIFNFVSLHHHHHLILLLATPAIIWFHLWLEYWIFTFFVRPRFSYQNWYCYALYLVWLFLFRGIEVDLSGGSLCRIGNFLLKLFDKFRKNLKFCLEIIKFLLIFF